MSAMPPCESTHPSSRASNIDYHQIWVMLNSTIFDVLNAEEHLALGRIRHFLGDHWMFIDTERNYEILDGDEVVNLCLRKSQRQMG